MSQADLATMWLLDPDQGVCPAGHRCQPDHQIGFRRCNECGYRGLAMVCWDVTVADIEVAERAGAAPQVAGWARSFLRDR